MNALKLTWAFDTRLSKSVAHGSARHKNRKTIISRAEHTVARNELASAIRQHPGNWYRAHLSIYLKVVMPRFLTDAVNYVDSIADAVRDGTGIDDKWFKFTVDWGIDRDNPRLELTVIQAATEHYAWCPLCGNMKPEVFFYYAKERRMGECRKCTKQLRKDQHIKRKSATI